MLYTANMRYVTTLFASVAMLCISACSHATSTFHGKVVYSQPVPFIAVRAYTGDQPTLIAAGGSRVGTVSASADSFSSAIVMLSRTAACHGASHFIVVYIEHVVPDKDHPDVRYDVEAAAYKVPSARIGELHVALWPTGVLNTSWCHR